MAADDRQMRHADLDFVAVLNDRYALEAFRIVAPDRLRVRQKTPIDLVNDLQMARHDSFKQAHRPSFQRFRQKRVISICDRGAGNLPRNRPLQIVLVDENAHQLRNSQCGMSVIELNSHLRWESTEVFTTSGESPYYIVHRAGHKEIFLQQPE